nr:hypothetical protein [Tanacetum cinerariifolium]
MGDTNLIRTLGDYSKPSHKGYMNTIELPEGNNVVPLRSDIIRIAKESWALLEDLALYDNESWNDPRDFAKLIKEISLLQDLPMNKITSSCEIFSGPNDTHYCMESLEQAFVEYASSRTDETRSRQFAINQGQRSFNEAVNAWKGKPNFNWAYAQTFTSPWNGSFSTYASSHQTKLEKELIDFDSHREKRLSSLRTQLGQQQDDMISKVNILWKTISERLDDTFEDEANEEGNVKSSTIEYEDHEMTVESEEEFEEETKEEIKKEEEDSQEHFDTFPTMKELRLRFEAKGASQEARRETPKVLTRAWDKFFEIQHAQPEDIQELLCKLLKDLQIIKEELAEYINSPSWNQPAFYNNDDDEEYSIQGTSILALFQKIESDEVIKSSVENLIPIPSESKGIFDDTCDVPFCDNSPPLDVLTGHFELFSKFNDDFTSSDDDYFKDIDYVEASPLDYELVSLEEVQDDILYEKLLNINLLIAKIEYLNDNFTPDCVLNDHTEETSSGSTTTHADNSLLEYDSFLFEIKPVRVSCPELLWKIFWENLVFMCLMCYPPIPSFIRIQTSLLLMILLDPVLKFRFLSELETRFSIQGYSLKSNPRDFYLRILFLQHTIALDLEASRARGFVHHPLELQSFAYGNPIS